MARIAVVGSGYVGLVTGACCAELGNSVICVDNNAGKVASLKRGVMPIYEPGLKELVARNVKEKRLRFSTSIEAAVRESEIIFIAVGTPALPNGDADLSGVEKVARTLARRMRSYRLIVEKSTVPVETGEWVKRTIAENVRAGVEFDVASNPEFLREGTAIADFMHPDRIVVGVESVRARELMTKLYKPLKAPILFTNIKSAELIKHASNAFLASKISFINALSRICERVGADVEEVAEGMGMDKRIGRSFLNAGLGYGGSCFPKDLDAFISIAKKLGDDLNLLREVRRINEGQKLLFFGKIKTALGKLKGRTIAVLGLAFKPDTDDIRCAPSLDLIRMLKAEGVRLRAYDPEAMAKMKEVFKDLTYCKDAYDACSGADCALMITEWNEFKELDLARLKKTMRAPLIIDGRNMYDPDAMHKFGFTYYCVGRGRRVKRSAG